MRNKSQTTAVDAIASLPMMAPPFTAIASSIEKAFNAGVVIAFQGLDCGRAGRVGEGPAAVRLRLDQLRLHKEFIELHENEAF